MVGLCSVIVKAVTNLHFYFMKRLFPFLILLMFSLGVSSCAKNGTGDDEDKTEQLVVSSNIFNVPSAGGTVKVEVSSNFAYKVFVPASASWVTAVDSRALSVDTLSLTISANDSGVERSAVIELRNSQDEALQSITVKQEAGMTLSGLQNIVKSMAPLASLSHYGGITFNAWIEYIYGSNMVVVDNTTSPTAFVILGTFDKYTVGQHISFTLENAQVLSATDYTHYISQATITELGDSAMMSVPEITPTDVNSGNYYGRYVVVKNIKNDQPFGEWNGVNGGVLYPFHDSNNQTCRLLASYQFTDEYVSDLQGDARGLVLDAPNGYALYLTTVEDAGVLACPRFAGTVKTPEAATTLAEGTYYVMLKDVVMGQNSCYFMTSSFSKPRFGTVRATLNQRTGEYIMPSTATVVKLWRSRVGNGHYYMQVGSQFFVATGKTNGYVAMVGAGSVSWEILPDDEGWYLNSDGGWPQSVAGAAKTQDFVNYTVSIYSASSLSGIVDHKPLFLVPVKSNAYDSYTHPESEAPLVLPFTFAGKGLLDILGMKSVWSYNIGPDYADGTYKLKFGEDANRGASSLMFHVGSAVGSINLKVKMTGGASPSSFTVQGSSDASTFTDIQTLAVEGEQNSTLDLTTTQTVPSEYRYIRIVFNKGSNVGLGSLTISPKQ